MSFEAIQPGGARLHHVAFAALLLAACRSADVEAPVRQPPPEEPAPAWPAWPATRPEALALVKRETRRAPTPGSVPPAATAPRLLERLRRQNREGRLIAGWDAIVEWLQARQDAALGSGRSTYLLWGTHHDAGAQVDAFRRVIGPLGLRGVSAVVAEPFRADGRWTGVEAACQRGDGADLAAYAEGGRRDKLLALRRSQIENDYTAWKYGFVDRVVELASAARAAGAPLVGCDAPRCLVRRLWGVDTDESMRMRELHCWLALRDALGPNPATPRSIAMLWGQAHVGDDGIQRFFEPNAEVIRVHLVGGRESESALEAELTGKVALTEPVLLLAEAQPAAHTLLLPDRRLAARVERVHDPELPPAQGGGLSLWSHVAVVVELGDRTLPVDETPTRVHPPAGRHTLVVVSGDALLVGSVTIPAGGDAEVELDPRARRMTVTTRARARRPP